MNTTTIQLELFGFSETEIATNPPVGESQAMANGTASEVVPNSTKSLPPQPETCKPRALSVATHNATPVHNLIAFVGGEGEAFRDTTSLFPLACGDPVTRFSDPDGSKLGLVWPFLSQWQSPCPTRIIGEMLRQVPQKSRLSQDCPQRTRLRYLAKELHPSEVVRQKPRTHILPGNPDEHRVRECSKNKGFSAVTPKSDPHAQAPNASGCAGNDESIAVDRATGEIRYYDGHQHQLTTSQRGAALKWGTLS